MKSEHPAPKRRLIVELWAMIATAGVLMVLIPFAGEDVISALLILAISATLALRLQFLYRELVAVLKNDD